MFTLKCRLRRFSSYVSASAKRGISPSGGAAIFLLHEGSPSSADDLFRYKLDLASRSSKFPLEIIYNAIDYRSKFLKFIAQNQEIGELLKKLNVEFKRIRQKQSQNLQHGLQQLVPELGPFSCFTIDTFYENISKIKNENFSKVLFFPCYPHSSLYSERCLKQFSKSFQAKYSKVIRSWPIHPCLIEAYVSAIRNELGNFPYDIRHEVALIFCYPLPKMNPQVSNLYQQQIAATCQRILEHGAFTRRENRPHVLAHFTPWTSFSPFYGFFDDQQNFKRNLRYFKNILIIPIYSIIGEDFDLEFTLKRCIFNEKFKRKQKLEYVRFLEPVTDDERFTQGLAEIVKNYLLEKEFVHYTRIL